MSIVQGQTLNASDLISAFAACAKIPGQNTPNNREPLGYEAGGVLWNFDRRQFPNWAKAKSAVQTGTGRAILACVGDSLTRGDHCGNGGAGNFNSQSLYAWPAQLARALAAAGIPTTNDGIMGGAFFTSAAQMLQTDPRLTLGADWSLDPSQFTAGGAYLQQLTGTSALTYTPSAAWDTAVIFYANNPGQNGTFRVSVGSTTLATINSGLSPLGITGAVLTNPLGLNTLSIAATAVANGVYIAGVYFYNSAVPAVDVLNLGWGGSRSDQWANPPGGIAAIGPLAGLAAIKPNLTFLSLMTNDFNQGYSVASYTAAMQTIITALQNQNSDIIGVVPWPTANAQVPIATQLLFRNELYALAAANNFPLVDIPYQEQSWEVAYAAGYMFDNFHPFMTGHANVARSALRPVLMV